MQLIFNVEGWYEGLSTKFLTTRTARLLVLAGTDRLDDELMIGQMQGKFQLVVVPGVGHMLQEVCTFLFFCAIPNPFCPSRTIQ
jgi:pimeloyl-ACP methyl ester carboxylesterase